MWGGASIMVTTQSRRDVLKIGGLGVLGAAGAAVMPWPMGVGANSVSRLNASRMPLPFRTRFARTPVLRPYKSVRAQDGTWVDHFSVTERAGHAEIAPGVSTRVFGYN